MTVALSPIITVFNEGAVAPSAWVYVYLAGTTSLITTFADADLTVENANPIVADGNGQFTMYIGTTDNIRLDMYTNGGIRRGGSYIGSIDPLFPAILTGGGGGGGGGDITAQRVISSGSSDTASTDDGLIIWNSATTSAKSQTIPASSGSLKRMKIMDFYGNSDVYPITITPLTGNINNTLASIDISTPGDSVELLDSTLGWIL